MFVGRLDKNFTLLSSSPCIDSGDPDPLFNDPDGSPNDMGALPYTLPDYVCGDADGSGVINILDVTTLINFLYKDGPAPEPIGSGDANGNGDCNILDITHLIGYLYQEGPEPVCP
jgi:hypothetical protein